MKNKLFLIGGILVLLAFLSAFNFACAQKTCAAKAKVDQQSLLGTWEGSYTADNQLHKFTVQFTEEGDHLKASLTSAEGKQKNQAYEVKYCNGNEFHLKQTMNGRTYDFAGTVEKDEIKGKLKIKKGEELVQAEPFTLKRKSTQLSSLE